MYLTPMKLWVEKSINKNYIMKNSLKFTLLLFVSGLISCSGPMDHSVTEPIPIEELKTIIDKDTLFELTYKAVQKIRETKLTDDVEKAKWSDITYKNVHDVVLLYGDSTLQNKYIPKIKDKWESKFSSDLKKADSISDYWKKYIEDNSIENYAEVELFDIQDYRVGLRITPLKGTLDAISIYYSFIEKEKKDEISKFEKYPITFKRTTHYHVFPRTSKSKIIWERDYEFNDIIGDKLLEEVLKEYVFKFYLSSVTVNGVRHTDYTLLRELPTDIKLMLEYEAQGLDRFKEKVIQDYLNKDYLSFNMYKLNKVDSIIKVLHPETIKFLNLMDEDNK